MTGLNLDNPTDEKIVSVQLHDVHCTGCADSVLETLRSNPHITNTHLDWANNVVHVTYHPGMIDVREIEGLIEGTGCRCEPDAKETPHYKHDMPGDIQHLAHGVAMQPITMGTKHDRMQYEMAASGAQKHHAHEHNEIVQPPGLSTGEPGMPNRHSHGEPAPSTQETGHSGHAAGQAQAASMPAHETHETQASHTEGHAAGHSGQMDHSSHAGMGHDMSDMSNMSSPDMAAAMERDMRNKFFVALLLTIPTVLYSPLGRSLLGISLPTLGVDTNWIMLVLSTPVVFYAGWMFIGGAYHSLRRGMLNMSVLIATGVLAAYLFSVLITFIGGETFFEAAAMLVTFVLFGHWMEMRARRGTNDAMRALFDLVPPRATVIRDGEELSIPSADVLVSDVVLLRPGDKVPVDGVVIEGQSTIDEALVTGESAPVRKAPGDEVVAGSINGTGSVRFRATKVGAETTVAQIVELVQRAQNSKAPGQRLADKAAQYLVILAVGSGLITFFAWFFLGNVPVITALTFAISAVVIACPDALGLATPTVVAVGTGIGARHNILIKNAATLEGISSTTAIVLDKTGTLTEGKPSLTDVVVTGSIGEEELLRLVASAEVGSEHPLAEAIVKGARERGIEPVAVTHFSAIAGHGIEATVDGRAVLVGNLKLMRDRNIDVSTLEPQAAALAEVARTPMYIAVDGIAAGLVAVADKIKASAAQAVRGLQERGIEVVMITGDNRRTAEAVAASLGIQRVFAEVLPADKARYVQQLQSEGKKVAMVGDGVNDAPALAQADTGIAIGAGTDVAIETADVVLMKSDPADILRAYTLSKATVTKMKQNLVWASVYNVLAIPVAAGVLYPAYGIMLRPEWSALLMSLSSIIVASNAVLLKRVEGELGELGEPDAGKDSTQVGTARPSTTTL
ncbi:MAG: heavy metal translocating P-type ATPase [Chloroflexota bacterium]